MTGSTGSADATAQAEYRQSFEPAEAVAKRFTAMLRDLTAIEATTPVPGLDWTAAGVGAHVLSTLRRYITDMRRAPTRTALAEQNALGVEEIGTDLKVIADGIDEHIALLKSFYTAIPLEQEFDFHAGQKVTAAAGWANVVGEMFVHGDDIARAKGRSWGVPAADLEGIWRCLLPVAAGWLRPEARLIDERWVLRFDFGTITVHLDHGSVTVHDGSTASGIAGPRVVEVDDTVVTTLAFPYRRRLITDPQLALLASRFLDI